MYETIKTNLQDGILILTLNRPEVMNAYTQKMNKELLHFYKAVNNNDDVRVIIVTGSGRAFCAGMDLNEGFSTEKSVEDFRDLGGQVSMQVYEVNKPIIAAINGSAIGIGMTMTLPMDIRIVKKNAKIGFVFGRRGIGPEAGSGWFLPKVVGIGKALEWTLTGRYIATNEALQAGLVQYEEEEPLAKAFEIARDIVENTAATSNVFTRQLLWGMLGQEHPYNSHLEESKFLHWASRNEDVIEGIQSFIEKRPAEFPLKASDLPEIFKQKRRMY
ncbi:enoyl-CoA hydratase [Sporosarcina sp. P3]|uniref:enoyl-CoA hydratase-related protein n=1 Tax=Sporosarcina sp. P3 TaxID=2048245 RepID=UPI000C172405|nr:enoyl-CoA hydratase-related protein [Sporosarcina sp. P3]PID20359.1 enoyl-CoA hydratase [Sporosarcina sp. P3]